MKQKIIIIISVLLVNSPVLSQQNYPAAVEKFEINIEGKHVMMAYMDVKPVDSIHPKNILLLHGKNFNGYYWKELIPYLKASGYRIIIPDQVGWGQSDRINLHYSFHMLADNTKLLLQQLGINKIIVLGHSMGGMLATRFTLMYPAIVEKLILEDPIGLEDYKTFIPYQTIDSLYKNERSATHDSYKKYQESYYPVWQPRYIQYVDEQAKDLQRTDFDTIAFVNALTYQMIYEQPVCYEFNKLKVPVLLVTGTADRTVVGKEKLPEADKALFGNYPGLGKLTKDKISSAVLKEMDGVGHIPHIQDTKEFWKIISDWLN